MVLTRPIRTTKLVVRLQETLDEMMEEPSLLQRFPAFLYRPLSAGLACLLLLLYNRAVMPPFLLLVWGWATEVGTEYSEDY